ncbi:hypothetical protein [Natrarchaeobaculum sulfurireducens]|nr:hypothetical protein [Natrarchaeobaculum sulfurireducens]
MRGTPDILLEVGPDSDVELVVGFRLDGELHVLGEADSGRLEFHREEF